MNNTYVITNRKLKDTDKRHVLLYGNKQWFLDENAVDEIECKKINFTFSVNGLNRSEYISDKFIIRKMGIERKAKSC